MRRRMIRMVGRLAFERRWQRHVVDAEQQRPACACTSAIAFSSAAAAVPSWHARQVVACCDPVAIDQ